MGWGPQVTVPQDAGPADIEGSAAARVRVVWVVSSIMPEAAHLFDVRETPFGGWLVGSAGALRGSAVELAIVHPGVGASRDQRVSDTGTFVSLPARNFEREFEAFLAERRPDVVHVHGTEGTHALSAVRTARHLGIPSVVSIQGLLSYCAVHYLNGIPSRVRYGFTLRDVLRRTNPELGRRDFARRGRDELEAIRGANLAVGRTDWDRACVSTTAPSVDYAHCDEVMRPSFYSTSWRQDRCRRNSILVSQGAYPLKGLHRVLEALPLVLSAFPDAHLVVAGPDPTHARSRTGMLRRGAYGSFLRRTIARDGLNDHVSFVGVQSESSMLDRLLDANVFVLPSSIENSPNSLAEAMLLGVPAVSSYVGGVPSMVGSDGGVTFYQHDAPYMLANAIIEVFRDGEAATARAVVARSNAMARHDAARHATVLSGIYWELAR